MTEEKIQTLEEFAARDLWWEARQTTAALRQPGWMSFVSAVLRLASFWRPRTFSAGASVLMVDLNKYRPAVNVEALIDQGVQLFGLRVGGPGQWIYGAWNYQVDPTFPIYYDRIRSYAKKTGRVVWILGYGVHNAWSDEDSNYTRPVDPQLQWFREAVQNQRCDLYCWDDEVGTCWMNGKETRITAVNLVKSISHLMEQTLLQTERNPNGSFKIPVHYSASWFMKQYAPANYQTWLDNAGRDAANRRFLSWRAWYAQPFTTSYESLRGLVDVLLTPTGLQENAYFKMGSEPPADLWQFTSTAKGPWEAALGCDASTSYGLSLTPAKLILNANLTTTPPSPVDTTPPTQPGNLVALFQNGAVTLEWAPSSDAVGVVNYQVSRDGVTIGSTGPAVQTYSDNTVLAARTYTYQVIARDAAGNSSAPASVTVSVPPGSTPPPVDLSSIVEQLTRIETGVNEIREILK